MSPLCVPDITHSMAAHFPPGKPASQFIFEVRDCRKSSFCETAKFLFTSSDHAERDVLENTVVGKECKEPFTIIRRRPGSRPFIGNFSKSDVTMTGSFVVIQSASGHVVAIQTNLVRELNLFRYMLHALDRAR